MSEKFRNYYLNSICGHRDFSRKDLIMIESEYLDSKQLAVFLNCSKKFIEKHRVAGRIPGSVKVGYSWRYRKSEIEKRLLSGQLLLPVDKG